jgi:hypothetical protein
MAKIFFHLARKRTKPALQPLILEPEDSERHRARVAAEQREAERIETERLLRMAERRAQRLACEARRRASEAEFDAIEETAISLFPWDVLWSRLALAPRRLQAALKLTGRRPYTNLAAIWAMFVIYGKDESIDPALKSCFPVNTDPQQIEPLIEFTARILSLRPDFDTDEFRKDARATAAAWAEHRKASRREWESMQGVVVEDFGGGWIATKLDVNQALFGVEP